MLFIFSMPELIRHLWQLKTVVFLHWCIICTLVLYITATVVLLDLVYSGDATTNIMGQRVFCIFIDYRGHHRKGVAI